MQTPQSDRAAVSETIQAGLISFAVVLGTGFDLGVVRVPFLVPRIGEQSAELAKMPIMAAVIDWAAGFVRRRFPEVATPSRSLTAGVLVLARSVVQDKTLADFIASRDKVFGSVYIAWLLLYAAMPTIWLPSLPSPPNASDHLVG